MSLHVANRPQFYAECAHLEVGGVGEREPGEEYLVRIPGVWSMDRESFFLFFLIFIRERGEGERC